MTCRLSYRCLRTTDSRLSLSPLSQWRLPVTLDASQALAYHGKRFKSKVDTPILRQLWHEVHKAESALGLPQTKPDGRWRELRLRVKAKDLVERTTQKLLNENGNSIEARTKIMRSMTPLEAELYNTEVEDLKGLVSEPPATLATKTPEAEDSEIGREAADKMRIERFKKIFGQTPEDGATKLRKPRDVARRERSKKDMEQWQVQKEALEDKFGQEAWAPKKRLSPDTLEGIRMLHKSDPDQYTTPWLANHFQVSPEAVRRILRSKWQPAAHEVDDRRERWERRGERIWASKSQKGVKPPKMWRERGVVAPKAGFYPPWKKGGMRKPEGAEPVPWDNAQEHRSISNQIL